MNGSARGTGLVVLVLSVPVLLGAMAWAARGSVRAQVVWLGAIGHLLYNAVMFLFGGPRREDPAGPACLVCANTGPPTARRPPAAGRSPPRRPGTALIWRDHYRNPR
jgi:hypothetical protein